jgi:hypothetical protein
VHGKIMTRYNCCCTTTHTHVVQVDNVREHTTTMKKIEFSTKQQNERQCRTRWRGRWLPKVRPRQGSQLRTSPCFGVWVAKPKRCEPTGDECGGLIWTGENIHAFAHEERTAPTLIAITKTSTTAKRKSLDKDCHARADETFDCQDDEANGNKFTT